MPVTTANTFKSGNSEAVRLPKGFGFGVGTRLRLEREGDRLVLAPTDAAPVAERLQTMFEAMDAVGPAILPRDDRDAPVAPDRG